MIYITTIITSNFVWFVLLVVLNQLLHTIIGAYIILGFYFLTQILKDVLNFLTEDKRYVGLRYGFCQW